MGPLYKYGWFDFSYSLQLAVLIGFCFGLLLERAGFGNPRKLTAIFYLRDFAVLKVMFTAIVVCMLGLLYFSVLGWLDLEKIYLLPTFIWPQIVGGLALGVGFIMGGYCPTTSVVATVSGKLDGLVFLAGMVIGSLIFAELFPLLEGFYNAGAMGAIRLSDFFGIQSGIVAFLVCIMAVGAFWLVERVEKRFGDPETLPEGGSKFKTIGAIVILILGLALAFLNPDGPASPGQESVKGADAKATTLDAPRSQAAPAAEGFKIVHDEGC
ncbi:MAG: sulfurtransferase [Desulfobacteraceae bacterium]|jgi:MFS family permease|nr:MAG: sulfurtransferase [Desulfobacteraceae bacterium]